MNELEKQIELIYHRADSHRDGFEALSKFFLEEIKEAYLEGYTNGTIPRMITDKDYLKSKYKI